MKIGIGPFSMRKQPENPSSHAEIYRQALEQVKLAEEVNLIQHGLQNTTSLEMGSVLPQLSPPLQWLQ